LRGVSGKNGMSDSTQIRRMQHSESGYFLTNSNIIFMFSAVFLCKGTKNSIL